MRYNNPVQYAHDSNGLPISGAKLNFYEPGTTTLKTIYSDSALSVPTTNPQVADINGNFAGDIFLDGLYAVVHTDASDITIWTKDPVGEVNDTNFTLWSSTVSYDQHTFVRGSDNEFYKALVGSNLGNDPTVSPVQWARIQLVTAGILTDNVRLTGRLSMDKGADLASAAALTLGSDGNYFDVTGTTAITSISDVGVGTVIRLHFDDALTLTHSADLVLPDDADIVTVAGDEATFVQYDVGDWRLTHYQPSLMRPYQQGTFTPILIGSGNLSDDGTDEGQTYNASLTTGSYIRIGQLVHFQMRIVMTSLGTLSGDMKAGGLPFQCISSSFACAVGVCNCVGPVGADAPNNVPPRPASFWA